MSMVLRMNSVTFPMVEEERGILEPLGAEIIEIEGADEREALEHAENADAVMIVSAYLRAPVIDQLSRCRVISRLGTGVDKIDIDAATRKGILVTNLPDFCTNEVADHTMALILSVARRIRGYEKAMREGRQPHDISLTRLSSATLGLVGFGRIGQAVARRALAFGMRVIAHDAFVAPETMAEAGVIPASLDDLLGQSDYVSLLCPLTPGTRGMLSIREFRKMKPSSVLVNTGRGELVVEDDLVTALREGIIQFAALDVFAGINVFAPGGFPTDHPFFEVENILMTPHVAAYSEQAMLDARSRGAQAVVDVLSGRWPKHPVNPEVVPWFEMEGNTSDD